MIRLPKNAIPASQISSIATVLNNIKDDINIKNRSLRSPCVKCKKILRVVVFSAKIKKRDCTAFGRISITLSKTAFFCNSCSAIFCKKCFKKHTPQKCFAIKFLPVPGVGTSNIGSGLGFGIIK